MSMIDYQILILSNDIWYYINDNPNEYENKWYKDVKLLIFAVAHSTNTMS